MLHSVKTRNILAIFVLHTIRAVGMAQEDAAQRAADDFQQLQLLFTDPVQFDYEVIRPIVLFAETIAARSAQTSTDRTTIGEKARRFVQKGMLGLVDQRATQSGRKPHTFPAPVAAYILYLKQLYPPIHDREIVRIVERKFGYKTNHHTVKHFLARYDIPVQLPLAWTVFHKFEDAYLYPSAFTCGTPARTSAQGG